MPSRPKPNLGFRVSGSGFRVEGSGLGFRVSSPKRETPSENDQGFHEAVIMAMIMAMIMAFGFLAVACLALV